MMRSAPHSGEVAVNPSIVSSGSKLIQHCRRKYSEGSILSHGTSQGNFFVWWSRRSSHGTSQPPLASRKMSLRPGYRSHTPPDVRKQSELITSNGLEMAWVK